jgi:hypothetical protein
LPKNFTLRSQKYRFGIRIQKNLLWIQDLFSHGSESGMEKFGSGIWDKHSGSATLHTYGRLYQRAIATATAVCYWTYTIQCYTIENDNRPGSKAPVHIIWRWINKDQLQELQFIINKAEFLCLKKRLHKNLRKKEFWPVSDPDANQGFGSKTNLNLYSLHTPYMYVLAAKVLNIDKW